MGLACASENDFEYDGDPDSWYWMCAFDIIEFERKRGCRCKSCNEMIRTGDECIGFDRIRSPRSEVEERIHGDEVYMAPWWYCERCANQAIALDALGFSWSLADDNMAELVKEYNVQYQGNDDPCGAGDITGDKPHL